ncbi:AAA family ATPase [Insolitispirillum peregrinum]|uniref:AAA family ATPase n=1 Tax=Insolitispirillum peregrinum TaxID=80876 RepID=UPI00361BDC4D
MIQFTKLRLSGFKSFVDPTELLIAPGMTGVVGPNGCGKSNLVEALRWVMGETSAKQMRGGEMDDVIFGGTSHRPARNLAEVTVVLDNAARTAPSLFNDAAEIEVTRRIERGDGSDYRFNGKPVRARDVQLLFADAATGARSTAMVSQGRVGALINAKPSQRRSLLEEAAGIGGLYTRRHEAELRLKAAEANLERLSDVMGALETQLGSLRRQARQAQRYRQLSEAIRATEALLLYRRWAEALTTLEEARQRLRDAESRVADITGFAAHASTEQALAAAAMPALRDADVEAGARLQRLIITREQLDAEEQRLVSQYQQAELRLRQVQEDLAREASRTQDAGQALEALLEEQALLDDASQGEEDMEVAARERVTQLGQQVEEEEGAVARLTHELARQDAARQAAERHLNDVMARHQRLRQRYQELAAAVAEAERQVDPDDGILLARERVEEAAGQLEELRLRAEEADEAAERAQEAYQQSRDALQDATSVRTRLRAECDALSAVLAQAAGDGDWSPVLDAIRVREGYEQALAAALGDDLSASEDARAPVFWLTLPPQSATPALPPGVVPLSEVVEAPPALARRLAQIGLLAEGQRGDSLRHLLMPGQRLVSADGALWRWDGLTGQAGAPSAAAIRLQQQNRLGHLRGDLAQAEQALEQATAVAEQARHQQDQAVATARTVRESVRATESQLASARTALAEEERKAQAAQARLAALSAQRDQAGTDLEDAAMDQEAAAEALESVPDSAVLRGELEQVRASLSERRLWLSEARLTLERVLRDAGERRQRLLRVRDEISGWQQRQQGAAAQQATLEQRQQDLSEELDILRDKPQEIAESRLVLLDAIAEAEQVRAAASDALAVGESRLAEADRALREAEKGISGLREDRVRAESAVEQGEQAVRQYAAAIAERLDCTPVQARVLARLEDTPASAGDAEPGTAIPVLSGAMAASMPLGDVESRLQKLVRDRDALGAVNLRAEQEAGELDQQMTTLTTERDDLVAAIARLRQGIAELNREGRQRLVASFEKVDTHFRRLFTRLFGGGRAHLALTESDDPLEAGLEIYASPPGKRLQILSLLSGGEQAMTAIALLFAVFLVNPAPICVLDEVDAPLDDANVDRFCSLLSELTRLAALSESEGGIANGGTRFLVITHHRMTMARMDRLYGVTMAERGVSKLVSVDLRAAEALRETA